MDDVLIVSAWDRGAWLAQQLRENLIKVKIVDVSSLFAHIPSVEREGPFGVFAPEDLSNTEKKYLCGDHYYKVSQGFCVLSPSGPVDMRGRLLDFMRETRADIQLCESILATKNKKLLRKQATSVKWLADVAAKWAASQFVDTASDLKNIQFSPLFAPYVCRENSARFFDYLYQEEKNCGIQRIPIKELKDIIATERYISLETEKEKHSARLLVWTLSVPEILAILPQMKDTLKHWSPPEWVWRRFDLSWDMDYFNSVVPMSIFIVRNTEEPWCEKNIMSIRRYPSSSQVDLWSLCHTDDTSPSVPSLPFPFSWKSIQNLQNSKSKDKDSQCHTYGNLSPANYFVYYESNNIKKRILKTHPLMYFLNPESVGKLDAYSVFNASQVLNKNLITRLKAS